MSSYFDEASLVMIPSGYKTSKLYSIKPTDGSGDLTFSRSNDTATRVGPNGLIEKVRTNLILQSNSFDTTWVNSNSTETSGQAGYDGTNNAWLLDKTGANGYIGQTVSYTGLYTQSIYVKAGTSNWLAIQNAGLASSLAYFDLQNGVVGTAQANVLYHTITSVGSGWYRCSVAYNGASGQARFFVADSDGVTSGTSGNILIQAAQLETGDIATQPILTTSAAVSVGPVANVPRLDYLNSSCPRLLLEPQRTNLALFSESFDDAYWGKSAGTTVTPNTTISPDGYTNADTIAFAAGSDSVNKIISIGLSVVNGTTYTISVFTKSTTQVVNFGGATGGTGTNVYNGAVDYGNGWYRQSVTRTWSASATVNVQIILSLGSAGSIIAYGFQAELGAYATSYIPTLGSASTRGSDAASKTGISSLIGQTEGTLFVEFVNDGNNNTSIDRIISVSDGTANNRMYLARLSIGTSFFVSVASGTQTSEINGTIMPQGIVKIAVAYKNNDVAMYVNGSLIGTDTSHTTPATSNLYLGQENAGTTNSLWKPYKQALLFKTRLSNADLAALTA